MSFILYGSLLYISLKAIILGIFGKKAVFHITPKKNKKVSFLKIILLQWQELLFVLVFSLICWFLVGSILPIILIVITSTSSIILHLFSNYESKKIQKIDKEFVYFLKNEDKSMMLKKLNKSNKISNKSIN